LKKMIEAFGQEITRLLKKRRVLDLAPDFMVDDIVKRLDKDKKVRCCITQYTSNSDFTVLINGQHVDAFL